MPVKQLEAPCWKPCAPGEKPTQEGLHWDTKDRAAEYADPGDTVLPLAEPCWEVVCDGLPGQPCGEHLEDTGEGWTVHTNPADAANDAGREGWEIGDDGTVNCAQCIDESLRKAEADA